MDKGICTESVFYKYSIPKGIEQQGKQEKQPMNATRPCAFRHKIFIEETIL